MLIHQTGCFSDDIFLAFPRKGLAEKTVGAQPDHACGEAFSLVKVLAKSWNAVKLMPD